MFYNLESCCDNCKTSKYSDIVLLIVVNTLKFKQRDSVIEYEGQSANNQRSDFELFSFYRLQ